MLLGRPIRVCSGRVDVLAPRLRSIVRWRKKALWFELRLIMCSWQFRLSSAVQVRPLVKF